MEKMIDFFSEHWIILIVVNFFAVAFIIGYLYEKRNEDKNKKKKNYNDMIIFDNQIASLNINDNNKIKKDNIENEKENKNINIKQENIKKNENIHSIDNETKKQIHDNIEYIINQNNSVFEEFNNVVPKKNVIEDKIKKELEIVDKENKKILKQEKKDINIDTNIELPEINISVDDEDIWS